MTDKAVFAVRTNPMSCENQPMGGAGSHMCTSVFAKVIIFRPFMKLMHGCIPEILALK